MDRSAVLYQLDDLPRTFKRTGNAYQWLISSLGMGVFRYADATNNLLYQTNFADATGSWIDVWGKVLNILRQNDEADDIYKNRITSTLLAWRGPPNAIVSYLYNSYGIRATVTENFPSVGWNLSLISSINQNSIVAIIESLGFVRPAGVPFTVYGLQGGLFLNTINYLGKYRVTGSYLTAPLQNVALGIPAYTSNATPQLPSLLLTDPILNPSLAASQASAQTISASGITPTPAPPAPSIENIRIISTGTSDTATITDSTVAWNSATVGNKSETLPASSTGTVGIIITIKDEYGNAETYPITITSVSSTIDEAASYAINVNFGSVTLQSDGAGNWVVL